MNAIQRAAKHYGNRRQMALALGLSEYAVYQWRRIPAERCQRIAQDTGIPLHELRPDLYPRAAA